MPSRGCSWPAISAGGINFKLEGLVARGPSCDNEPDGLFKALTQKGYFTTNVSS